MKINEDKLKQIIREEVDEGLGGIARSARAGVKRLKSKATTAVKKALVDPFKLAKTEEDFLNVMKNMIPDSGDEGKSDEKWLKQWNFLKKQYLKSPTVKGRWKKSWDPLGHATEEAEILASAAMEEPIIDPTLEENKTKLTKSQLKQIIKEEISEVLGENVGDLPDWIKEKPLMGMDAGLSYQMFRGWLVAQMQAGALARPQNEEQLEIAYNKLYRIMDPKDTSHLEDL